MKKIPLFLLLNLLSAFSLLHAQDTFSIVAVDSTTGEVGSAGASCLGVIVPYAPQGALIISDVVPGKGAIHTQALWDSTNQKNADSLLLAGMKPADMILWLMQNDVQGDSTIRQYGIVELNGGHPVTAAYTGSGTSDYKGHILGKNYSIQGNILLGRKVLDSIEARFNRTKGPLADKLMAALQGAKMVGADTRCAPHGTSSLSSFLRVAKPGDQRGKLWLDIHMSYANNITGTIKVDPIDSLQTIYNRQKAGIESFISQAAPQTHLYYTDRNEAMLDFTAYTSVSHVEVWICDVQGRMISQKPVNASSVALFGEGGYKPGIYLYRIVMNGRVVQNGKAVR